MKNKLRICVIGAGRWGQNHMRTLETLGCLAGIVDNNEERLEKVRERYLEVACFECIDQAMRVGFDGYVVATPAATHYPVGKILLEAGQNVLLEKPMALCATESEALVKLSKQYGGKLMVGHQLLYHPAIMKIKEVVEAGVIGKLLYIKSTRLNLGVVRQNENVVWSLAPHDLSIMNYLVGEYPINMVAQGSTFLQPGIIDMAHIQLDYSKQIKAYIDVSWIAPVKEQKLVIVGSQGMLVFDDASQEKDITLYKKCIDLDTPQPLSRDDGMEKIPYVHTQPLQNELAYFIEVIGDDKRVEHGKEGHQVICLLEAMREIG